MSSSLLTGRSILKLFLVFCLALATAESFSAKTPAKLYINVVVKDPSDAIANKLDAEISKSILPRFMKTRLTSNAGKLAGKVVQPNMVAAKMAAKMEHDMPQKMALKGIGADVKEYFREGPYFVMQLQVRHVDAAVMAAAKTENKSIGTKVQKLLQFVGTKRQNRLEEYLLPSLVSKKMPDMMTEMMSGEMAGKGVKADAKVLPEKKQEKYFEAKLAEVRKLADREGQLLDREEL